MSINEKDTSAILSDTNTLSSILATEVNPVGDLPPHSPAGPSDSDSFYVLSYLKSDDRKFTVLFHVIVLNRPSPPGPVSLVAISVLDETDQPPAYYFSKEVNDFGLGKTEISADALDIRLFGDDRTRPLGVLSGTLDELKVEGRVNDDNGQPKLEIELALHALGPTFPYLASGVIPFPGGLNYEYAFPRMVTSGKLIVQGELYQVTGTSWFDREWGHVGSAKWTWINIQLNNGIQLAVWDQQKYDKASNRNVGGQAFATILDPQGSITATIVSIEEGSFWTSPDRKRTYANSWKVVVPGKAELKVETLMPGQEIVSIIPRVEAKCTAQGSYDSKDVTGDAFAEVGEIPPF